MSLPAQKVYRVFKDTQSSGNDENATYLGMVRASSGYQALQYAARKFNELSQHLTVWLKAPRS